MIWSDPIVKASFLQSIGFTRTLFLLPAIVSEWGPYQLAPVMRLRMAGWLFCLAAPAAAAYLLELERDGRLDQMRLSGQAPTRVAVRALLAHMVPWVGLGLVVLLLATQWEPLTPESAAVFALGIGGSTAIAAFVAAEPIVSRYLDRRIVIAVMGIAGVSAGAFTRDELTHPTLAARWVAAAIAVEFILTMFFVSRLPRRIAYASAKSDVQESIVRKFHLRALLNRPHLYRGWAQAAAGFALWPLFGAMSAMMFWFSPATTSETDRMTVLFLPTYFILAIGFITVGLISREDAATRQLDIVRISPQPVGIIAVEAMMGLWLPFLISAAALGATVMIVGAARGALPVAWFVPLLVWLVAAPFPFVEGWQGLWPMALSLPLFLTAAVSRLTGPGVIVVLAAAGWCAVLRMLRDPRGPLLDNRVATAILAALIVACCMFMEPTSRNATSAAGIISAGIVSLSPLLIAARDADRRRFAQPLAIAVVVMAAGSFSFGFSMALLMVPLPLATWLISDRLRQWTADRPPIEFVLRVALLVAVVLAGVPR